MKLPKIKALRIKGKLTREEVANRLGISKEAYRWYELGYREPKAKIIKELSKIFKCTTDELLKEEVT